MRHLATLLCLSALVSACGSKPGEPGAPTNPSAIPSAQSSPTLISVGEEVSGVMENHNDSYVYELIAPLNGMLTARLTWPTQDALELSVADSVFPFQSSPEVGRLPVAAGQKYRVKVTATPGDPWDSDAMYVRFTLSTSIE